MLDRSGFPDQQGFHGGGLFRGVDAGAVVGGDDAVDGSAVFQGAELFEAFGEFQRGWGPGDELIQKGAAVAVEAHVAVTGEARLRISGIGQGAAAEVEGAAGVIQHRFDDIGVVLEGGVVQGVDGGDHADAVIGSEAGGEFADEGRGDEGFVALDVDEVGGGGVVGLVGYLT